MDTLVVMCGFSCSKACGILASDQPGIKPTSPALQAKFLNTVLAKPYQDHQFVLDQESKTGLTVENQLVYFTTLIELWRKKSSISAETYLKRFNIYI